MTHVIVSYCTNHLPPLSVDEVRVWFENTMPNDVIYKPLNGRY